MIDFDPGEIGLKVGLEVHQQLKTQAKLFCSCNTMDKEEFSHHFVRRLRPTQSELGQVDPAALFEFQKGRIFEYFASKRTSCLVEADEEPPHDLNPEAVESTLLIALALKATPVDEIHVMRKIVIDGSNTTGFQRTAIIAQGGSFRVDKKIIPVQTVCLEEDAARLLREDHFEREYGLDRLCIPMLEVALAPITDTPERIEEVALAIGRLMRSTGRVARGLGTIRQDINISLAGQGVVEVKGVQKLNLLSKVIEFEVNRQLGLLQVSFELRKRGVQVEDIESAPTDVTCLYGTSTNEILKKAFKTGGRVLAIKLKGFGKLLGFEPNPGVRLGKEMAEIVRFYGLGGIFHSDELPGYNIVESDVQELRNKLMVEKEDGFVILAGGKNEVFEAAAALIDRARKAINGIPAETRGATEDGKTRFIRPRPGAARMYPETDIPPMTISQDVVERARRQIPKSWEEQIEYYRVHYGLSEKLAFQIYDSDFSDSFKKIVSTTKVSPSFIAATLTETLVNLSRTGFDTSTLQDDIFEDIFTAVDRGELAKEAVPLVLEKVLRCDATDVDDAIKQLGLQAMTREELRQVVCDIIDRNRHEVLIKGEKSFSSFMGRVMNAVRGKADGRVVSIVLKEEINKVIKEGPRNSM